jgi:exodeoxyribonuclease VII small subunit
MPKAASKAPAEPTSYESALQELEQLIAQIESGQFPQEHMHARKHRAPPRLAYFPGPHDAVQEQVKVLDEGTLAPWSQE